MAGAIKSEHSLFCHYLFLPCALSTHPMQACHKVGADRFFVIQSALAILLLTRSQEHLSQHETMPTHSFRWFLKPGVCRTKQSWNEPHYTRNMQLREELGQRLCHIPSPTLSRPQFHQNSLALVQAEGERSFSNFLRWIGLKARAVGLMCEIH